MRKELVRDWMSPEVISVGPDTPLPKAHQLMVENTIRRLPVLQKDGRLMGIVTLSDVRAAEPSQATTLSVWELNYLLANLKVKQIMSRSPVTIDQMATIGEAARVMLDNKISGLPVVDQTGAVVGIITESDIFRMVVRHEWNEVPAYA